MNISQSLLYLLLLYAVLDRENKLSLTNGLVIAFVILLINCYVKCCRCGNTLQTLSNSNDGSFTFLNNI